MLPVSNEKGSVNFVDVTRVFHLADCTVNGGYVLQDGVNITRSATSKVDWKLNLKMKDKKEGFCRSYSHPSQIRMTPVVRGSSIRSDYDKSDK